VLATAPAELTEGQALGRRFLVFGGGVIATFAITTLKHNVVPRHKLISLL
jgi:hypothetical protein